MGVLDRGEVGRLVPPALPPLEPAAPLRRLVLVAAVRALAAALLAAGAGLEDTVWAVTVRAGVSAGVAAATFAGAAVAGAGMAVTGVVAAAGAGLPADAFGAAALAAIAWDELVRAAAARDRGVAMAGGDGAR